MKTQQKTAPMPQSEAQVFIMRMKKLEMRYYVAWTPGWKEWIPVKEILKDESSYFPLPPPTDSTDRSITHLTQAFGDKSYNTQLTNDPNRERTYTEISLNPNNKFDSDFKVEAVNWDNTPVFPTLKKNKFQDDEDDERREYKRFPHRIEIVLMTKKGRSFRSSSQNISLGGALLREPVPADLLKDIIDLVIINPFPDKDTPSHLLFKGRVLGDVKDRRRLMFYDVSPEVQTKLQHILEKYKKNYAAHKKKRAA